MKWYQRLFAHGESDRNMKLTAYFNQVSELESRGALPLGVILNSFIFAFCANKNGHRGGSCNFNRQVTFALKYDST
jgi:hypothetical protein